MYSFQTYSKKSKNNALVAARRMKDAAFWMRFATHQGLGEIAEKYVLFWLRSQGFIARYTGDLKHKGDVTAIDADTGEIIRFEVKAARTHKDDAYHYCIKKRGKTSAYHSDYVVMLAVDNHHHIYRYIVPLEMFGTVTKAKISSHLTKYSGKFAPFRLHDDAINLNDIQTTYQLIGATS